MAQQEGEDCYQPQGRFGHSTVKVGNYHYMWVGYQSDIPDDHESERKKRYTSRVELFDLLTGKWDWKSTTGNPPLGIKGYSSIVIDNEIIFFGGFCGHGSCYHNSLFSMDNSFHWKELSQSSSVSGFPTRKRYCGMIHVKIDGYSYIAVFGGNATPFNNSPHQHGSEYDGILNNEIHYYSLSTGQWISPNVTGDRPPPCYGFSLTSITDDTAILFGGHTPNGDSNMLYIVNFEKSSVNWKRLSKPLSTSVEWPKERHSHSSVLISITSEPHLLVVGGVDVSDCWLFNISKEIWKELNLPDFITGREGHTLTLYNITPVTVWIMEFGGKRGKKTVSDTAIIELTYITYTDDKWSVGTVPLDQYQQKLKERKREWEESHTKQPSTDITEQLAEKKRQIQKLSSLLCDREKEILGLRQQNKERVEEIERELREQLRIKNLELQKKDEEIKTLKKTLEELTHNPVPNPVPKPVPNPVPDPVPDPVPKRMHILASGPPDIRKLMTILCDIPDISSDWQVICVALNINPKDIEGINNVVSLSYVLYRWRDTGSLPFTWQTIIDAIKGPIVKNPYKAKQIENALIV